MHRLILASQSPRRFTILENEGWEFSTISLKVSEILDKNLNVDGQIMDLARRKAEAVVRSGKLVKSEPNLVLGADTVVVIGDEVLGKPENETEAHAHLCKLAGQWHSVKTGICLWETVQNLVITACAETKVEFFPLRTEEIAEYISSAEPMDKAGAYAIQGKGGRFVKSVVGSYANVVGLPIELVRKVIADNGWNIAKRKS